MKRVSFRIMAWAAMGVVVLSASRAFAQDGGLSPQDLATLQSSFRMDDHARETYNAITAIDISQLTLNRDLVRKHNDLFTDKIKTSGVTNQLASGRCWLFAGLNILRPNVAAKHKLGKFELSQSYLAFWDKLEKANCFFEDVIDLADRDPLDRDLQTVLTRRRLGRRLVGVRFRLDQEVRRGPPGDHAGDPQFVEHGADEPRAPQHAQGGSGAAPPTQAGGQVAGRG